MKSSGLLVSLAIVEELLWLVYFYGLHNGRVRQWQDALFVFLLINVGVVMMAGWFVVGDEIVKELKTMLQDR